MTDTVEQISRILHEAGGTHHRIFRIVDGADDGIHRQIARAALEDYYSSRVLGHFSSLGH